MISLQLETADFENIRFAFSPLMDAVTSYRILRDHPAHHPAYHPWMEEASRALYGIDFPYMDAVVLERHYIADFATPTPISTRATFEDELERMRQVPTEVI